MSQATLDLVLCRGTKLHISNNQLDIVWAEDSTPGSKMNRKVLDMTDSETEALIASLKAARKGK